jgi:hypothetical protein
VRKRAVAHWHPKLGDLYEYATYDAMGARRRGLREGG